MTALLRGHPYVAAASMLVIAFLGGSIGRWVSDREPPTAMLDARPITYLVRPGGELRIRYHVQRFRTSCAVLVTRMIYDSQKARYILDDRRFPVVPGPPGEDAYIVPVTLPDGMATGEAIYRTVTSYECNPFHSIWPIVTPQVDIHFRVEGDPIVRPVAPTNPN